MSCPEFDVAHSKANCKGNHGDFLSLGKQRLERHWLFGYCDTFSIQVLSEHWPQQLHIKGKQTDSAIQIKQESLRQGCRMHHCMLWFHSNSWNIPPLHPSRYCPQFTILTKCEKVTMMKYSQHVFLILHICEGNRFKLGTPTFWQLLCFWANFMNCHPIMRENPLQNQQQQQQQQQQQHHQHHQQQVRLC